MKIYVVTSGCYSDYHIEAVYTDEDKAKAYANLHSDRTVEKYEADTVSVTADPLYARVCYKPKYNVISAISTNEWWFGRLSHPRPDEYTKYNDVFTFYCVLSDRTKEDIEKNGNDSSLLLKAAQDRWARFCGKEQGI